MKENSKKEENEKEIIIIIIIIMIKESVEVVQEYSLLIIGNFAG